MARVNTKSIKISEDTHKRLDAYRRKGETYNDVINWLLGAVGQVIAMNLEIKGTGK